MKNLNHKVDLCIVGGGMAGMCAAIAAARQGTKVALMQDRPVLGGNASSEIRMWICGAQGPSNRETGILEEMQMENLYRNPTPNYSIWDSILYEKVRFEKNIELLLNCSCTDAKMNEDEIKSIKGWQLTTETWHTVEARYFSDCSGDSILSLLSGAEFRQGREASSEFNESIEPSKSDKKTMGMSCLFQVRETDRAQSFTPPVWANKYVTDEDFPAREHDLKTNYWWIEIGGENDTIHDAEELRDELLKIVFGVWDHIKNYGDHGADNWVIDWLGFLPGKRESRRNVGDYTLNQNDIASGGKFEDLVAYGGWSMDDHHPEGFKYKGGYPTIFHEAPSPFGIPYRCLYSVNIKNLFFAGRNISGTHVAMSATRVMATCAIIGQVVGIAASIAVNKDLTPRGVYEKEIKNLQQMLMEEDCYLPWHKRKIWKLTRKANISDKTGSAEILKNGYDRPIGNEDNGWMGNLGEWVQCSFENLEQINELRFVFDSNLNREIHNMPCNYPLIQNDFHVPETMIKEFRIEAQDECGNWIKVAEIKNNYQRLVKLKLDFKTKGIRFIPIITWGFEKAHVFSWDLR
ncbi:MAG TPA: FAD-dependent oxidoreductase [Clostridium sp.]